MGVWGGYGAGSCTDKSPALTTSCTSRYSIAAISGCVSKSGGALGGGGGGALTPPAERLSVVSLSLSTYKSVRPYVSTPLCQYLVEYVRL